MSDLHLTADKSMIWGVDTYNQFEKALRKIQSMNDIECIIVTGDIADDGKTETYIYADNKFKELGIPTFWCYGNHDSISELKNCGLTFVRLCDQIDLGDCMLVFVNSVKVDDDIPSQNCSKGYIAYEELGRLKNILESTKGSPVIIAMHHPSIEPGGWLSNKILKNRVEFNEFISTYNVIGVLYGHIHYFTSVNINSTIYSSCSSVGFAFDKVLPKYQIAKGKEGFSLINVCKNYINIENILI